MGALLANLATFFGALRDSARGEREPFRADSPFQHMETAWSHLALERGSLQIAIGELVKLDRDRVLQCVNDQMSEFADRQRAKRGATNPSGSNRYRRKNRRRIRPRREGAGRDRELKRSKNYRGRSPRDSKDVKSAKYNNPVGNKGGELKKDSKKIKISQYNFDVCSSLLFLL